MIETSLHQCASEIATLWNKGKLHLFSHQSRKKKNTLLHTWGCLGPYTIFFYKI